MSKESAMTPATSNNRRKGENWEDLQRQGPVYTYQMPDPWARLSAATCNVIRTPLAENGGHDRIKPWVLVLVEIGRRLEWHHEYRYHAIDLFSRRGSLPSYGEY